MDFLHAGAKKRRKLSLQFSTAYAKQQRKVLIFIHNVHKYLLMLQGADVCFIGGKYLFYMLIDCGILMLLKKMRSSLFTER